MQTELSLQTPVVTPTDWKRGAVAVLGYSALPFTVESLQDDSPLIIAAVEEQCFHEVDFLKANNCGHDLNGGLLHIGTNSFSLGAATVTELCDSGLPINAVFPCLCLHELPSWPNTCYRGRERWP